MERRVLPLSAPGRPENTARRKSECRTITIAEGDAELGGSKLKEDEKDPVKGALSLEYLCKVCLLFLMGVQLTGSEIALL